MISNQTMDSMQQEEKSLEKLDANQASDGKNTLDKDSYLNRDDFTSEHFKVEIRNLPKNFGFGVKPILKNMVHES